MRKWTRFITTVSVAALLAAGVSMTSFAAQGWQEEGGQWFYYNKDGSMAEDAWVKSGNDWYWMDSEKGGAWATDKFIEDGDDLYYVDENGRRRTNGWLRVLNEEQDGENPAGYHFYYFQGNGKAYKGDGTTRFKTIDGKKYAFDEDGRMLYGWVGGNSNRLTGEDDWAEVSAEVYYCGSWDDGSMKTGWQNIYVHDAIEDEDRDHWFYFKSNGKRFYNDGDNKMKERKVNGKTYGFDERGVMVYQWTLATGSNASPSSWKYFNDPEDGVRATKGWFKVVAAMEDNSFGNAIESLGTEENPNTFDYTNASDGTEKWYYADDKGNLKEGEIAKINSKYYGFAPEGYMLVGLVFMSVDEDGLISDLYDDDVDADDLDDIMNGTGDYMDFGDEAASLYYFGPDGVMKTGPATVNIEGENHKFLFSKTGGVEKRGKGVSGIEDGKYIYKYGMKMKADRDDKYRVVRVWQSEGIHSELPGSGVAELSGQFLRREFESIDHYKNKDDDTVKAIILGENSDWYLLNTAGTIVREKTAAKDGDGWYYYVKDKQIRMYTDNKILAPKKDEDGNNVNGYLNLSNWKEFTEMVSPE